MEERQCKISEIIRIVSNADSLKLPDIAVDMVYRILKNFTT